MLTKDVTILFAGLLRLFQRLASHVCVVLFFLLLSGRASVSHAHSLWDAFFCSMLRSTAKLFHPVCCSQTHDGLKSTPASMVATIPLWLLEPPATDAVDVWLLCCPVAPGASSGGGGLLKEKEVVTKDYCWPGRLQSTSYFGSLVAVSFEFLSCIRMSFLNPKCPLRQFFLLHSFFFLLCLLKQSYLLFIFFLDYF